MTGDVSPYTGMITSEHADKPKFVATVAFAAQPFADNIATAEALETLFDLDTAVGQQLDTVGQWIGLTRYLKTPVAGAFFSWGTPGLGWGEGFWRSPGDSPGELVVLPDDQYRTLLRAKVVANHWNGAIDKDPSLYVNGDVNGQLKPGAIDTSAYAIFDAIFAGTGFTFFIEDHGDLTMSLGLIGMNPDPLTLALFKGGYLDVKPAGVRIKDYVTATGSGKIFSWGIESPIFGGWGEASWATHTPAP